VRFRKRPAVIVAPERDTPGTSASACAQPMRKPSRAVRVSTSRSRRLTRSASSITRPKAMSIAEIR
jgi:hypothetical protein